MKTVGRVFDDLKVRPKLVVLHNLFFAVLAAAVYFSVVPHLERSLADSEAIRHAKWTLFAVLGAVYVFAVLMLELVIMPRYAYRPLRLMLEADEATQRGDRSGELIAEEFIAGDEIGQIMRSRNATVAELRKQEDTLAEALARLEETASDLRRKNDLLETAKKHLADQDRLVSVGLLSAGVAHELNTPLAVLQGSIEKLLETAPDETARERLLRIDRATERLRQISESLLDFARPPESGAGRVDIRSTVEEAWSMVAIDRKSAGIHFLNEVDKEHAVIGNAARLVQVFVNLIRNAVNAIPDTGSILVRSQRLERNGRVWLEITLEDDGCGIPAHVLPSIFEAFVTTRLDSQGTGLGLTIAEGIVSQHGGAIEASNRPAGGARLQVRLPAIHSEAIA